MDICLHSTALAAQGIGSVAHRMQTVYVPAESDIEQNVVTCANMDSGLLHVAYKHLFALY